MSVEIARGVGPARLDIAYERFGEPDLPPVLLLMGLGTQMLGWPDGFCEALTGRGVHVIRSDNRDIGLSSHLTEAPAPISLRSSAVTRPRRRTRCPTWPGTRWGCSTRSAWTARTWSGRRWAG